MLADVAVGSGTEGALGVEGRIVHGEHQHRQVRMTHPDVLQHLQAIAGSEGKISNDQIGPGGDDRRQPFLVRGGFRADPEIRFAIIEKIAKPIYLTPLISTNNY